MRRGFTLIEVAIVTAIFGILLAGAVVSFQNLRGGSTLHSATDFVKTRLEKSRLATLSKEDGSGWSVKVNEYNLTWFKGQIFNPASPDNKTLILPVGARVSSVNLENSGAIVFFNT